MSKRLTLQIVACIALLASGLPLVRDLAEARDLRVLQQRNLERMRLYERLLPGGCLGEELDSFKGAMYGSAPKDGVVELWAVEVWGDRRDSLGPYTQYLMFDCK